MPNHATKSDLRKATDVYKSKFAKKAKLASSKSDIGELQTALVDLSKLSDVIKKKVVKKLHMMNWLKKLMLFRLMILLI